MKHVLSLIILLILGQQVFACDASIEKFSRDCWIQDRFEKIRETYAAKGIDINEIGEYKVLRFIDRNSWEKAKRLKTAPLDIYEPAPATWKVWEGGIDALFKGIPLKNSLFSGVNLDRNTFSKINKVLLTDGTISIKDKITDQSKQPGEFRENTDKVVGFCAAFGSTDRYREAIRISEDSMDRYLKRWESETGVSFKEIVLNEKGPASNDANLLSEMQVTRRSCNQGSGMFVEYSQSHRVKDQIEWIRIFIKNNLQAFQRNNAQIAPVELAAVVQKWFVSVHPFADGNGRTSRAVQELIMHHFGLPFIPGGDLQNDALEDVDKYIENTYKSLDLMLSTLETCARDRELADIPRACQTIKELNDKVHAQADNQIQQYQNAGS